MFGPQLRGLVVLRAALSKVTSLLEELTVLSTSKNLAPKAMNEPGHVTISRASSQGPVALYLC